MNDDVTYDFPTPVWWVSASSANIAIIGTGEIAGDGTVEDEFALVLSGDSSYAIEGSREELLSLLDAARLFVETCQR